MIKGNSEKLAKDFSKRILVNEVLEEVDRLLRVPDRVKVLVSEIEKIVGEIGAEEEIKEIRKRVLAIRRKAMKKIEEGDW